MTFERPPEAERKPIREDDVESAFKSLGKDDPEAVRLFQEWLDQEEGRVAENASYQATTEFNRTIARLYERVSLIDEALDAWDSVLTQAVQEHNQELEIEAQEALKRLRHEHEV